MKVEKEVLCTMYCSSQCFLASYSCFFPVLPAPPMGIPPPLMFRPPPLGIRLPPGPPPGRPTLPPGPPPGRPPNLPPGPPPGLPPRLMGIRLPPGPPPGLPPMLRLPMVPLPNVTPNVLSAAPQLINRDDKKSEQKGATIEAKAQLRYVLTLRINLSGIPVYLKFWLLWLVNHF